MDPDVYFTMSQEVFQKMHAFAMMSKGEISGFGKTRTIRKDDTITVEILDVRIFKQEVNPAHTKLDRGALADFYFSLIRENEDPAQWNLWWHSHHDFGVFFSGEDTSTIADLSGNDAYSLYSICINKRGQMVGRSDRKGNEIEAEIIVSSPVDETMLVKCKKEVDELVAYSSLFNRPEWQGKNLRDWYTKTRGEYEPPETDAFKKTQAPWEQERMDLID